MAKVSFSGLVLLPRASVSVCLNMGITAKQIEAIAPNNGSKAIDITLEKGYILIEGLLSKTGSYGQEKITYASRQFENTSKAVGNPSEKVIYFDKDNSWDMEILQFVNFIKNNKKVNINNIDDAYEAMKIVRQAYISNK